MGVKKKSPRPRRRRAKRRKPTRSRRIRVYAALLITTVVVAGALLLHTYVSVTARFDGRVWKLPSRVFSDTLVVRPGDPVSASAIEARLARCGYARTAGAPGKPGQFRLEGDRLQVHLRPLAAPTDRAPARLRELRFRGERVRRLLDERGRRLRRVVFEPEVMATLYGPRQEERRLVRIEEVPPQFLDAVLAAEDARFHEHHGLDLRGIARAGWVNLREGEIVQGGSTITQQTVKNLFLGQERTWWRKSREAVMALMIDARYSKERILEVYLNEVYLGQRGPVAICGVQAASMFFFGRSIDDLLLGERALLAGLIRSPGRYNPFVHPERAKARRGQILQAMLALGMVDEPAVERAGVEPLLLASGAGGFSHAPYAVDLVRAKLAERFSSRAVLEEGLNVFTTIDTSLQERAESVVRNGLEALERGVPAVRRQADQRELQGALLVTRPGSGAIVALVGGRDYEQSQFNRVTQARRQPGSCFKPLVFAAGFELAAQQEADGLTPATILDDSPLSMRSGGQTWEPANYDGTYRGPVTARQALEESLNVPTVRAAQRVGLEEVIRTARRCGVDSPLRPLPSLALGTAEVTPLELATVYGAFSQQGRRVTPWIIRAVTDREGNRLEGRAVEWTRGISPQTAFLVDDLLQGVFERGTAKSAFRLGLRGNAAGKTGTTDGTRDSWFVGYNRELLTLVWVGYDDNARTGLTGATGALPIWVDFMKTRSGAETWDLPERPAGMVRRVIDPETGMLVTPRCPTARVEWFAPGTEPTEECAEHRGRFRRWFRKMFRRDKRDPV